MFSVLLWHKEKWFGPNWANQWQQVFPDTIFKHLSPTATLLVCSTEPWWEGEIVCGLNKELVCILYAWRFTVHALSINARYWRAVKQTWTVVKLSHTHTHTTDTHIHTQHIDTNHMHTQTTDTNHRYTPYRYTHTIVTHHIDTRHKDKHTKSTLIKD